MHTNLSYFWSALLVFGLCVITWLLCDFLHNSALLFHRLYNILGGLEKGTFKIIYREENVVITKPAPEMEHHPMDNQPDGCKFHSAPEPEDIRLEDGSPATKQI